MIDVASELKKRKARRIFAVATFGLFTNGLESFDAAVEKGVIDKVVTTNLIYQTPDGTITTQNMLINQAMEGLPK